MHFVLTLAFSVKLKTLKEIPSLSSATGHGADLKIKAILVQNIQSVFIIVLSSNDVLRVLEKKIQVLDQLVGSLHICIKLSLPYLSVFSFPFLNVCL